MKFYLLSSLCAVLLAVASATPVVLVDSVQHAYLQTGPAAALAKSEVASLCAALTGLVPGSVITADQSRQLAGIAKPSALKHPRAFAAVNVAGLSPDVLGDLLSNRAHRTVELTGDGCPAMAVVNALARISAANPSVKLSVVDHDGVQNCKDDCVEQNLAAASAAAGVDLSGLDLTQPEAKLLAVELASVFAGLKSQIAAVQQRAESGAAQADVELYEVSIMGLKALAAKVGSESEAMAAATNAVLRLLKWAVDGLDAAYEGDVVMQMLFLSKGAARTETVKQVASWKDTTRRQLLSATFPGPDQVAESKNFSAKAAGYGAFILLLYFLLAGVWCMCNMPFKQDTLLYGSTKKDS
ncbi:hypothetical protein HYH02_004550 [Chlamydomonas schloesseri]|uniref:DUF7794 domain-containing protein n=1 Tax=Chlamydomonas schloesseri TaxID=2026947 RepID=A0A836B8B1_9CHLO|nr:hypothetical protein HYH02_004550 [Chlamydomonas schloesseri]|eukprot:KAG2450712.1 hypothetical protein HYH02_004550 [Chlamydomonas schloesseri]